MHLFFDNAELAFRGIVSSIENGRKGGAATRWLQVIPTVEAPSRNGKVYVVEEPMTITYKHPHHRVIFNPARDANPFFHVFESLWMLAGRNDVKPLMYFVRDFDRYAEEGIMNGAYGYRWRKAEVHDFFDGSRVSTTKPFDQLSIIAKNLRDNPMCRRQVLDMWNVKDDLLKTETSKDVCCNLNAMFLVRQRVGGMEIGDVTLCHEKILDMTVTNRSNDTVLGMLGANVVHFSFLHEYMAVATGCKLGVYNQFTNNMHAYEWNWKPKEWLAVYDAEEHRDMHSPPKGSTPSYPNMAIVPLVDSIERFDKEVQHFIDAPEEHYHEPFLQYVAAPMYGAHRCYKEAKYADSLRLANMIEGEDWRRASVEWITRRLNKRGIKV